MNVKTKFYISVAKKTIREMTVSWENWTSFLKTMAWNYEFTYPEQVMIYAQRPNAVFCKSYEEWNEQYGRYVKRGAKGIALFVTNQDKPYLRYVFDAADTGVRRSSPVMAAWRVTDENHFYLVEAMERVFQVPSEGALEFQLEKIADNLTSEYWSEFKQPILDIIAGSSLEEYDEYSIKEAFKAAVTNSVSYVLYSRITGNPDNYFEQKDFQNVFEFNTQTTVNALGTAINTVSTRILGELEKAIEAFEKTKAVERSQNDERNDLQTSRGLSDSGHRTEEHRSQTAGQIRKNEESISAGEQSDSAERSDSWGAAVSTPSGDRRNGTPQSGTADDRITGEESGTGQSLTADGLGTVHEQPESAGRGNRDSGTYQQLSLNLFPPEEEQIRRIDEAESEMPSAFSFVQEQVDLALIHGGNVANHRMSIALEYGKGKSAEEIARHLPELYHGGNGFRLDNMEYAVWFDKQGMYAAKGKSARYSPSRHSISWQEAAERIGVLLESGGFATDLELEEAPGYERTKVAESFWYLYHDLSGTAREQGYFSSLRELQGRDFPEETAELSEKLKDDKFRTSFQLEYQNFLQAYKEEPSLLRFHYHKLEQLGQQLKELDLPLREYQSKMTILPTVRQFITEDEIDEALSAGSGFSGGKERIFEYWKAEHSAKEKVEFLKKEYGTGGRSHALSGSDSSHEDYDAKGIRYSKKDCDTVRLSWTQAAARIDFLMEKNRYVFSNDLEETYIPENLPEEPAEITEENLGITEAAEKVYYPSAPVYQVGNTVYLENQEYQITELRKDTVQLLPAGMAYPVYRVESREQFEQILKEDLRNGAITEYLWADPERADPDLRKVLADSLFSWQDKEYVSRWIRNGEGNTRIRQRLSDLYSDRTDNVPLSNGDTAEYHTSTLGIRIEILDGDGQKKAVSVHGWEDIIPLLRGFYVKELAQFYQDSDLFQRYAAEQTLGDFEKDFIVRDRMTGEYYARDGEYLTFDDVEEAENLADQLNHTVLQGIPTYQTGDRVILPALDHPIVGTIEKIDEPTIYISTGPYAWSNETVNREQFETWLRQDERNAGLFRSEDREIQNAEIPVLSEENRSESQKTELQNFHITNEHLGEGGPKQKFRANIMAIQLLKKCEEENRPATPEEQEILSGYVGWGGLSDAFDESKGNWSTEYLELKTVLTPDEYAAARASTLNAYYTSPTVIRAIYEVVEQLGFRKGNILEPAMGVGNFFGLLPDSLQESRLYGVELDSISGRIARKLYPKAEITVAGFETTDRRDFYDLAVGNVPFGDYKVNDKPYNKLGFSIHNYFFAKALDQVRPGGIVAFVTSRYTMDAKSPEVRRYLAQRAELLGAIRLPNTAFRANAGTEVVSDIVFLQKRERPIDLDADWIHLGSTEEGISMNSYFVEHLEMVLGKVSLETTQYGREELTILPFEGKELGSLLKEAVSHIQGSYQEAAQEYTEPGESREVLPADPSVKNFSYTVIDDTVYYRENSVMIPAELNETAKKRIKGMVNLRQILNTLIDYQMEDYPQGEIKAKQKELNQAYDTFTEEFGLINSKGNERAFSDDSSYYLLCSLENIGENGELESKADIFTKRTIRPYHPVTHVDLPSEALAVSIGERGRVDLPFMAGLLGNPGEYDGIIKDLKGVIFRDPLFAGEWEQGWQTADEYLSGNVRDKLRIARLAAKDDSRYLVNVEALEKAQPKDLDASEIDVRLGATWIDAKYIQQFMEETFDTPYYLRRIIEVQYSAITAEWRINGKSAPSYNDVAAYVTYGTDRANAYKILEDTLNLKDARIYDTIEDADGNKKRVINKKETTLAQQKQQAIKDAFRDWIWRDPKRRAALVGKYNQLFNSTRPREYDGSHIRFVGMNPDIRLRPHQLNAIAHVLYGGNTLLAHEVGAGKTFEMAASAMESKRLGLCQKSMFVVPNHLTQQWANEFLRLYPSAKLLVTTKKDFETSRRKKFCTRIASGDYDAVIIGHSQFEKIPISAERQERLLQEQIDDVTEALDELKRSRGENFTIKQMEKTRKTLQTRLDKLLADDKKDDVITFEQLGVDLLFVDESQAYKNLFIYTKMRNVAGLSASEAQRSSDMFMKCRYMDELTGGRGIIFASGTPVSNSMTELYTVMRYLQYHTLQQKGLTHFDCWASTFGESITAIELAPEGTGYRARTRFAKFFNLPELMSMFKEVADIKTSDQLNLPVPETKFETVVVQPSQFQKEMVASLSKRASAVHKGLIDPSEDNMLKITSDGRKIGLDQRLMNPLLPDDPGSKLNTCVENVFRIWEEGKENRLTQLLFCDMSTPKQDGSFNVYDDMKKKLTARGVPAEEIAFIHDADTEVKKKELFSKVRMGQVRVLLGSTQKMGAGTNVQDRLIAVHHLDVGWRPSDMTQRNGRIIRQGNQNKEVQIYQYVTEGTFDAYLYQTLENKQRFISQIMTSKSPVRSCEDVDEQALSFAEIKALCAGDSRIKEKMDLDIEVSRLKVFKADHQSKQYRLEDQLLKYFPAEIEKQDSLIRGLEADIKTAADHPLPEEGFAGAEIQGIMFSEKELAGEAVLAACKTCTGTEPELLGSYRGFSMELSFNSFYQEYKISLRGAVTHTVTLGTNASGNFIRMDHVIADLEKQKETAEIQLENLKNQEEAAKEEVKKPFPQEKELAEKSARLAELDAALNMDEDPMEEEKEEPEERTSVLEELKSKTPVPGTGQKRGKEQEEVL